MSDPTPIKPPETPSSSSVSTTVDTPSATQTTTTTSVTPGWKTSEFWTKIAAVIVSTLLASGVIPTTGVWAQVTAILATVLAAMGYTVGRSMVKAAAMRGPVLALLMSMSLFGCAPPVVVGAAGVAAVSAGGCATFPHAVCQSGVLVPPDATACELAFLQTVADLPASLAACRVDKFSSACVDAVIAQVKDILPCEPTCQAVAGRRGAGNTQHVSPSTQRTNVCESLRSAGYQTACR